MAKVASGTCFTYKPSPDKSVDENLQMMFEHMHNIVESGVPFVIKLEVEAEAMNVKEVNDIIKDAMAEVVAMEKDTMVPVAVDKDNTTVYKRKADIKD